MTGSMVLSIPVALLAGLLSFVSPCTLPMLPAYLSYATGLSGETLAARKGGSRQRMLWGSVLFVLGFAVVFVLLGVAIGSASRWFLRYSDTFDVVLGILVIALGLVFLGALPGLQRDLRVHRVPAVGVMAAPVVGFLFGLGWTPCIGPTLGAISTLAAQSGSAARGGVLLAAFALGLGAPFVLISVFWSRALGTLGWLRRHQRTITRVGGLLMILIGVAILTGWWTWAVQWLQVHLVAHWQGVAV